MPEPPAVVKFVYGCTQRHQSLDFGFPQVAMFAIGGRVHHFMQQSSLDCRPWHQPRKKPDEYYPHMTENPTRALCPLLGWAETAQRPILWRSDPVALGRLQSAVHFRLFRNIRRGKRLCAFFSTTLAGELVLQAQSAGH